VNRWVKYFCKILNLEQVGGIRQREIQTAEPFVTVPSVSDVEVAIGNMKSYKSPGTDQIPAEIFKMGEKHYILRSIKLLN
jgi:hypothetical protein